MKTHASIEAQGIALRQVMLKGCWLHRSYRSFFPTEKCQVMIDNSWFSHLPLHSVREFSDLRMFFLFRLEVCNVWRHVNGCLQSPTRQTALWFFAILGEQRLTPNAISYSNSISACARAEESSCGIVMLTHPIPSDYGVWTWYDRDPRYLNCSGKIWWTHMSG